MATDLLTVVKNISALKEFVTKGELGTCIGEIEFQAAREALSKAKIASDPAGQLWSAVNHLETAHHALSSQYKNRGAFYDSMAKRFKMDIAAATDRRGLFYMAICYSCLGEWRLALRALADGRNANTDSE